MVRSRSGTPFVADVTLKLSAMKAFEPTLDALYRRKPDRQYACQVFVILLLVKPPQPFNSRLSAMSSPCLQPASSDDRLVRTGVSNDRCCKWGATFERHDGQAEYFYFG
ncbi:hypothetical protein EVAR_26399_1 [Eumeta japonica]|uniref:Uncharacterized protein n=1 Tax=Eumeta variegata TaxID=151549 RepID=A0A4C1VNN9_EUMVA|nr:hypothetical protein EVAR_26399_1 [Eumeta japonica]